MSIMSKLKGDKKNAGNDKQTGTGKSQEQPKQDQTRPVETTRRSWTAQDMRQINRTTEMIGLSRSRSSGDFSVSSSRPSSRHRMARSSSGLSQDWAPAAQRSSTASLKMMSRNSFQGLAKVVEDGSDSVDPYEMPPMPPFPARYSSSSLASSSKGKAARSPLSAGSSVAKSPLSTAGSLNHSQVLRNHTDNFLRNITCRQ